MQYPAILRGKIMKMLLWRNASVAPYARSLAKQKHRFFYSSKCSKIKRRDTIHEQGCGFGAMAPNAVPEDDLTAPRTKITVAPKPSLDLHRNL